MDAMITVELLRNGKVEVREGERGFSFELMNPNHPNFSQGGALLHMITGINRGLRYVQGGMTLIGV
jgi:hypothetical protein